MAKAEKKKLGRPRVANPLSVALRVRITPEMRSAIEAYQQKHSEEAELRELSDAVRHILGRMLRQEGLL